jgi:hypothetical protein
MQRAVWLLVISGILALPQSLPASEGGTTHYTPGAVATLIDLAPTKTGWIMEPIYLHYSGDAGASVQTPLIGQIALGLKVKSDSVLLGGLYAFQQPVLGAHYTAGAYLPYVSVDVEATLSTAFGSRSRKDSTSGVGDMTLIPAMLAWKSGSWQYNALLPIYAPTGSFKTDRLANPGLNYWTFDPTVGVSYNNEKNGFNAALYAGLSFNTTNSDTNYRSGTLLHFDGSVQQLFPAGTGFLGIGAEAFYLDQVSGDSGSGARLGDFEGRTMGIGPVLTYVLPLGKEALVAELRWLPETSVKNRLDGDYVWLKVVYQL